ncbi:MAG: hypothetical protein ACP5VP_02795 [Candidatus Limnocylindrales bacterium]
MTTPRRTRIDLHCHTARSDAVLAPPQLLAAMRDWGIALARQRRLRAALRLPRPASLGAPSLAVQQSAAGPGSTG